jgi:DNA-binding NtrC family response regulator
MSDPILNMPNSETLPTILLHSADRDLTKSLSFLLQEKFSIITSQCIEDLKRLRGDTSIALVVADLEKMVPQLLEEFQRWRREGISAPIIGLYAYRQKEPSLERSIRKIVGEVLYKPVPIDHVLKAIAHELHIANCTLLLQDLPTKKRIG